MTRGHRRRPSTTIARMWVSLAGFVVLMAGAAAVIMVGVGRKDAATATLNERVRPLATANLRARSDFAGGQALLFGYVATRQRHYLTSYRLAPGTVASQLAQAGTLAWDGVRADVATQQRAAARWFGYGDAMARLRPGAPAAAGIAGVSAGSSRAFYLASKRLGAQATGYERRLVTDGQWWLGVGEVGGIALLGTAFALGLAVTLDTRRSLTTPLAGVVTTLGHLTSGEHAARAAVAGAGEARQVARSVNALADELERLRALDEDAARLHAAVRGAGLRIREHLRAADVIGAARESLESIVAADHAYLHLLEGGALSLPAGRESGWLLDEEFLAGFDAEQLSLFEDVFRQRRSLVTQDVQGEEGELIPPGTRAPLRRAGIRSLLIAPFGVGADMLGLAVAVRLRPGAPWTNAEIAAVEAIVADLGTGLHHARLYEDEDRLVAELMAVDRAKSAFLTTVAHELRTPLTSIGGYLEILRDGQPGSLTATQQRMLDSMERNTSRLRTLVRQVLTLAERESGARQALAVPCDLADVAAAAVAGARPAAARGRIALSLSCPTPEGQLQVAGDRGQLEQAIAELLSNAVKFTPDGGQVRVWARAEGPAAVVSVEDTGVGIPEPERGKVFDRFFRGAGASARAIQGSGLGLAVVRTIAESHGGGVGLASQPGQGTTVTLRLPKLETPGAGEAPRPGS